MTHRTTRSRRRVHRVLIALVTLAPPLSLAAGSPRPASAQAICSAPHSSPTLAQSGSLKTLPAGGGWAQLSLFGQRATRFFSSRGHRQPFLADSEFDTRSAFLTGAVGVARGVELWAQLPVHRLDVESAGGDSRSSGIGDLRLAVRLGPEIVGRDWPLALRLGSKLPGSDFPVDATVLPLTEGQRDWEASLESGFPIPDHSLYLMGWMGYRWREENREAARDPGDEWFAHLALGGSAGRLSWEVALDGLVGRAPAAQGLRLDGERRRLLQLLPTAGWTAGPGRLEAAGQLPLGGRNLPVGFGASLGYRVSWGLAPAPVTDIRDFFKD